MAIFTQKIAVLMLCVPAAIVLHFMGDGISPVWNFSANFMSIIPLAWLISECTEHLEKKVGPAIGVLLNSTFGNVVEIILSIQAIRQGKVKLVQSSLMGAILMNLLFVLGCCFFVTGVKSHTTQFNTNNASYNLSLLAVATTALLVPTSQAVFDEWSLPIERLDLSRGVAILLAFMYIQWLVFNLSTHDKLFAQQTPIPGRNSSMNLGDGIDEADAESDEDEPALPMPIASAILGFATLLVTFHCDWLVESIDPVCTTLGVKKAFIATVLLPMVGNFSEEIAAVTIASKGKVDLAMGVAIGSATQIATMVIPIVVLLGWFLDQPLDLDFEVFQVKLLMFSILVAALCLQDGQANWLKGSMLMTAYLIIASAFWFVHDREYLSEGVAPVTMPYLNVSENLEDKVQRLEDALRATQAQLSSFHH